MIPYGLHDILQEDIDAVVEVLQSDFLTQGPRVPDFEGRVSKYCGSKYAVAVNSATSALHIACLSLRLGEGDWLWTSPITFVASANCALYCGARVDFVDIDPKTYNLCPVALEKKLEKAKQQDRIPKIVVVVHFSGQSGNMVKIKELSNLYGFKIIEDASHAIGGKYLDEPIGSCRYSDITVFSFHPVKIITTAEGGMALTNDPTLANAMMLIRSHGITRNPDEMQGPSHGSWYYQQITLGYNYRMTELQAALGYSQMNHLDMFVQRRQILARQYDNYLADLPLITPWQHPGSESSFHLYVIRLANGKSKSHHRDVFEYLRAKGIGVNLHYIPVHIQPYYSKMGFMPEDFPNAMSYYQEAISLPLFSGMSDAQQNEVVQRLTEVLM